ncbi:MAG: acylphosphatase [Pseudomarimonas sp.]
MTTERIAVLFRVRGRVQGVGYRAGCRREAQQLGVDGYAVNRDDGSVEVLAQGDPAAIESLARWLLHGSTHAQVTKVERENVALAQRAGFGVG